MKIKRNYSFWRHPIQWIKDRKKFQIMNLFLQYMTESGLEEEIAKTKLDMFLYGCAFMKDGKRIDPEKIM